MTKYFTVSEKALIGRINRVLAKQSLRLHKTRLRSPSLDTLGRYYILDTNTKALVDSHIPLAMYANDLGVVSVLEQLEDEHHTDRQKGVSAIKTGQNGGSHTHQSPTPNDVRLCIEGLVAQMLDLS